MMLWMDIRCSRVPEIKFFLVLASFCREISTLGTFWGFPLSKFLGQDSGTGIIKIFLGGKPMGRGLEHLPLGAEKIHGFRSFSACSVWSASKKNPPRRKTVRGAELHKPDLIARSEDHHRSLHPIGPWQKKGSEMQRSELVGMASM